MRASLVSSALVAALVGFGSTIALVLSAAAALGASAAETASWVFAICLVKAIGSAGLSLWSRVPVVLAWSTPGAALIAATSGISLAEATGAFLLAGALIALTGAIGPLGRLVGLIPDGIAAAMLAGVLLPFCLKGAGAVQGLPQIGLAMVAVFLLVRLFNPAMAVLAALVCGVGLAFLGGAAGPVDLTLARPVLVLARPEFRAEVLLGLGVPLYLVTMASQNLPGFAVLRAAGYTPPVRPALAVTGGLSMMGAFFGAHTINMAAITAAICLGAETHPDPARRWQVGLFYGAAWLGLGLLGPVILHVLAALPGELMVALVALALLGPLMGALTGAFGPAETRFASVVTLAVTASGITAFGVGAAFWGLAAGLAVVIAERQASRLRKR